MLKNYLKIALRRIRKHRLNTVINVFGLAVGIAAAVIIFLYAQNELTYDHFHKKSDDIYLIYKERVTPTGTQITRDTWLPMAEALKTAYSDIESTVRIWDSQEWVEVENRKFEEQITYADPSLFDVFTFPLQKGSVQKINEDLHAAVISQEIAQRFFGDADPIGRRIRINFETDYTVRGVLTEVPQNSTMETNIIIAPASAPFYERQADNWDGSWIFTFLKLRDGASPANIEAQLPQFITKTWGENENDRTNLKLSAFSDLHNDLTNTRGNTYILLSIAFIILAIASINFMNLTTARSLERAREIGLRKVLGAERKKLVMQFLSESFLICGFALALAVVLVELVLPWFNNLYNLSLALSYFDNLYTILALLGLALAISALAGLYPAFHLSRFQPADTIRGHVKKAASGLNLRLALVVAQFCMSIILIIATGVLFQQMRYMKTADLKFDKENLLVVETSQDDFADTEKAKQTLETFKNQVRQYSQVKSVSSSSHVPGRWPGSFLFAFPLKPGVEEQRMRMRWCAVDAHYFETMGMEFSEGHGFSDEMKAEGEKGVVLNEAALHDFGWETAAGHQLRIGRTNYNVLGVVKNYHYDSLEEPVSPVIHIYQPSDSRRHRMIAIKLAAGPVTGAIDQIRAEWQHLVPGNTMNYFFLDQNFSELYESEERLLRVATVFAGLAITIAALGLFALSSFTVQRRTKEIGIRKVLGATVGNAAFLLSLDFFKLVVVAILIAWPVAWFTMQRWLQDFAYRIDLGLGVFAVSGLIALAIALLTVIWQAIRAALANPVESLRYE